MCRSAYQDMGLNSPPILCTSMGSLKPSASSSSQISKARQNLFPLPQPSKREQEPPPKQIHEPCLMFHEHAVFLSKERSIPGCNIYPGSLLCNVSALRFSC